MDLWRFRFWGLGFTFCWSVGNSGKDIRIPGIILIQGLDKNRTPKVRTSKVQVGLRLSTPSQDLPKAVPLYVGEIRTTFRSSKTWRFMGNVTIFTWAYNL